MKIAVDFGVVDEEVSEINMSQEAYLELIRRSPTPPIIEYEGRSGPAETTTYEEPIQELLIESDDETDENEKEYQALPVKDLISTYEQGKLLQLIIAYACLVLNLFYIHTHFLHSLNILSYLILSRYLHTR